MADFAAPLSAGAPQSVMDYANQQQQFGDISSLRNIQGASQANELQNKQRAMQISMLSGVLKEQDPDKQRDLINKIVPITNKLGPQQFDANMDVPTIRALIQSQVPPEKQAEMSNELRKAQMLAGIQTSEIKTDPFTGQFVRVNKLTGQQFPVGENMAGSASLPGQQGGTFPYDEQPSPTMNQIASNQPATQPAAPTGNPEFGFDLSTYKQDANALKLARKNAADFEKNRSAKDTAINNVFGTLDLLEPQLNAVHGGDWFDQARLRTEGIYGSQEAKDAAGATQNTTDLARQLSQLGQLSGGGGGRATKLDLTTLLQSKPDPYGNYPENNQSALNKVRSQVKNIDLENKFLGALKDANPLHIIPNEAYKVLDGLRNQYPISSVVDGKEVYNAENAQAFENAIPDAIQNPKNYIGKTKASDEAGNRLKKPAEGETSLDTPEAIGEAYRSKKITKEQAKSLLAKKHGME